MKTLYWKSFIFAMLFVLMGCGIEEEVSHSPHSEAEEPKATVNNENETLSVAKESSENKTEKLEGDGKLEIHFLDVGQGDATLFLTEEVTILVDAGRHDRDDVVTYLEHIGVEGIDLLVGTHPHADHIGQMPDVLEAFFVEEVWMSGGEASSQIFKRTIESILASDASYHEPRAGESFVVGDLRIEVLHPLELSGDLNDDSVSMNVSFGDVNVLITGDAELGAEREILERGNHLDATVFRVGHHGSSTSNGRSFVTTVNPEVSVYSSGEGNQYGHPHREVVDLFSELDIPLYGTAEHGTITIITDGSGYELYTQKKPNDQSTSPGSNEEETDDETKDETIDMAVENSDCIDINEAVLNELVEIIHIGEARGLDLKELRPFESVRDLTRINGISESRLQKIKQQGLACVS
ncbi:MBL fold metallo-hydrolase [Alteribacter aurantiacus]|uniref:MBL fold metallo-hydrolase n=1 Tax=Alteribacter aurantiacus TaxID=254410 RepID=UPI000424521C|nr:MBL fold metallo-hydrolase [Alteribacter aurantiacus]